MAIQQTPSGPMLESASPDLLESLLANYGTRLKVAGVPVDEWLAPGVAEQTVREELESVGLIAPDELIVWFGWHNGRSTTIPREVSVHALPDFSPLSVGEAVKGYEREVLNFEAPPVYPGRTPIPDEFFQFGVTRGWMRLVGSVYGTAIECVSPPSEPPRLRSANEDFVESAPEGFYQAVSLCTLVNWWIESLDSGAFTWDATGGRWLVDQMRLPASQRAVLFS